MATNVVFNNKNVIFNGKNVVVGEVTPSIIPLDNLTFSGGQAGLSSYATTSTNSWTQTDGNIRSSTKITGHVQATAEFGYIAKWGSTTYTGGSFTHPYIHMYLRVINGSSTQNYLIASLESSDSFNINSPYQTSSRSYTIDQDYEINISQMSALNSTSSIQGYIVIGTSDSISGDANSFRFNKVNANASISGALN